MTRMLCFVASVKHNEFLQIGSKFVYILEKKVGIHPEMEQRRYEKRTDSFFPYKIRTKDASILKKEHLLFLIYSKGAPVYLL